jgi:hypothetical protein
LVTQAAHLWDWLVKVQLKARWEIAMVTETATTVSLVRVLRVASKQTAQCLATFLTSTMQTVTTSFLRVTPPRLHPQQPQTRTTVRYAVLTRAAYLC